MLTTFTKVATTGVATIMKTKMTEEITDLATIDKPPFLTEFKEWEMNLKRNLKVIGLLDVIEGSAMPQRTYNKCEQQLQKGKVQRMILKNCDDCSGLNLTLLSNKDSRSIRKSIEYWKGSLMPDRILCDLQELMFDLKR